MCGPLNRPRVKTRSLESNSGPYDCEEDALSHEHGHHNQRNKRLNAPELPSVQEIGVDFVFRMLIVIKSWHCSLIHRSCPVKIGLHASAKSIDPYQPARIAQAGMGQYFLNFINFVAGEGSSTSRTSHLFRVQESSTMLCMTCPIYCIAVMS